MDKFRSLVIVLLNSSFGISAIKQRLKKSKLEYLKILGIGAAVTAGFTPALLLYIQVLVDGFELLAPAGQAGAILTLGIVLVSTMIFYFGIFFVINTLYFAENIETLLFLPLKAWQVLGARFSVILVYEYLTELPFLIPPIIIYGVKSGAPIFYWIYAGIGFLLVPLVPLALATFLATVVMRFTNFGRRKDLFKILGGVFVIILAVGFQFLFQKSGPNAMNPEFLQQLLTNPDSVINVISRLFPTTIFLAKALVHSNSYNAFLNLLTFLGSSCLAIAIAWLVGGKLYFQGLNGLGEVAVKRRISNKSNFKQLAKVSSPMRSYFTKEIRLLVRTPIYFMNCVLSNFLMPVVLIIPFFLQSKNSQSSLPWEDLALNPKSQIILIAVISGITVFLVIVNSITSTSLSREGKQFFISKYIPLSYEKQIQAKLLSGYVFGLLGTLLMNIAIGILLKLNLDLIILIITITLVAIVPIIEVGLLIDIYRPKLDWDNEQKAVKQNLNSIFTMLIAAILAGSIGYIVIRYLETTLQAVLFILISYGSLGIVFYLILMSKGIAWYHSLEG